MTLLDFLTRDDLPGGCALDDTLEWLAETKPATADDVVATCHHGERLLWLAERSGVPEDMRSAAVRPAVMRAARVYAADACDATGLSEHAAAFRALPDDATNDDVNGVADDAAKAADAALQWARAHLWPDAVAKAESAARSAYAVGRAVREAIWAAKYAGLCDFIEIAGWAANSAPDQNAEHALCAADVRAAIPDLAERVQRAMEAA